MRVILAGYNVDLNGLKEYKRRNVILTPESLSAAYARISRSPKRVDRLRDEARKEVEKARRSNQRIIFRMGHHSVAEHAVFNFDIIGISRRAVEELERFRLCSYTEKSQRYVTLKGDFTIPAELRGSSLQDDYCKMVRLQNNFYKKVFDKLKTFYFKKFPELLKNRKTRRLLENRAKEDARYILPLATQTQLGTTINGRNLELIIRRFASHQLQEINELGKKLYAKVKKIAPSIILFYKANDYDRNTYQGLYEFAQNLRIGGKRSGSKDVELIYYTPDADQKILASLLFKVSGKDFKECLKKVQQMSFNEKRELFKKACIHLELYDVVLREFEFAELCYRLTVSGACFGQLKRHRMVSITWQDYDPGLGVTVPEAITEIGEKKGFMEIIKKTERVYKKIEKRFPGIGSYILTNAHQKRVLLNVNLRELYHISRLREDPTAQWDIRRKVEKLSALAKRRLPITTLLLGGKSDYPGIYKKLFGQNPKVTSVPEP